MTDVRQMSDAVRSERRAVGKLGLLTVVAVPAALGVETLMRHLILPADFELVRASLGPVLTLPAWIAVGATVLAGLLSSLVRSRFDRRADTKEPGSVRELRARTEGSFVAASIAQIPAVASTFCWMFGAPFTPIVVAVVVSTSMVAWHVWGPSGSRPHPPS